jgi:hypothetical protein
VSANVACRSRSLLMNPSLTLWSRLSTARLISSSRSAFASSIGRRAAKREVHPPESCIIDRLFLLARIEEEVLQQEEILNLVVAEIPLHYTVEGEIFKHTDRVFDGHPAQETQKVTDLRCRFRHTILHAPTFCPEPYRQVAHWSMDWNNFTGWPAHGSEEV